MGVIDINSSCNRLRFLIHLTFLPARINDVRISTYSQCFGIRANGIHRPARMESYCPDCLRVLQSCETDKLLLLLYVRLQNEHILTLGYTEHKESKMLTFAVGML